MKNICKKNATAIAFGGRRFTADTIIASGGLRTKSHTLTLGHPVRAFKTGVVVYRGMYSTDRLNNAPVAGEFICNIERPTLLALVANKIHCILIFTKTDVIIGITTEEEDDTNMSPLLQEAIRHAPDQSIVRWSLCFRNPQPCWTSTGGYVIQLGDSAHSFLPTSANGATQALEDALSLPNCLRLGGKEGLGAATKVHELLRYQHISLIQHFGFHQESNQEAMQKYPLLLMGKWLWAHNPEKYATENFRKACEHLETGSPFDNTNLPPGYKWSGWTVEANSPSKKPAF
ncbi:hypothetical protein F4814DRAFT_454506 [Daldinia grandis]|nr:hypothetical protein F4814DRAFT_454506 [Daldinia grandis]